ncbi:conjugal transfer mating-pair stabilization protein TraG [Serratia proteamaculans]|uniref:conjugal transfer mating-pair stabilization protein TraG n=1 Tax=Serratia proteamaculans TaxID=28151 RepID=UPI0039BEBD8C
MNEMYTIYGGDMWRQALNGIVTILGTSSWRTMLRIAEIISVLVVVFGFIKTRNPLAFVNWAVVLMLVTGVLLVPKRTVQIIDITDPAGVYVVDNVPAGLVAIGSLATSFGYNAARLYEYSLSRPDSILYTKTGMLFGSQIIAQSTDFKTANPQLAQMLPDYVENCVVGDVLLNHKYALRDLMNSTDPLTLITSNPSPLRGIYRVTNSTREFITCKTAAAEIKTLMNSDVSVTGSTWRHYASKIFGSKVTADTLLGPMLGDSYSFFYAGGLSASQIMRNNITNTAIRQGVQGYAARSGDTANLMNLASETALTKQRLAWSTGQTIAMRGLPFMQSLLMLFLICLFPLILLLAVINHDTFGLKTLKLYIGGFLYFQLWPLMFAILNFASNFYLQTKTGTTPLVLANLDQVALQHSDVANIAGWMSLSIPVLAGFVTRGVMSVSTQVASSFSSGAGETASRQASASAEGNWSFNNMSMDNVSGNKFDTNAMHRSGQSSRQADGGAMVTQTASGSTVYDTSGAISNLPVNVRLSELASSGFQKQAREAQTEAATSLEGYNHSVTSGWNQLSQMQTQSGNSDSVVSGSDSSQAANQSKGVSMMMSAAKSYAASHNISEQAAYNKLMDISNQGSANIGASIKADSGDQIAGKVGKWATGVSIEGHAGVEAKHTTGSTRGTQDTTSNTKDHRQEENSNEAKDFKQGMDMLTSNRVSTSGGHTDNSANSNVDQFAATLSDAKNHYQQYTNSMTRSSEYSEAATMAQNKSASLDTNYNQEFVEWTTAKYGDKATDILTNAPAAEKAATQFVEERLKPLVSADYESNRGALGEGMSSASAPAGSRAAVNDDFAANQENIRSRAADANIQGDMKTKVAGLRSENQQAVNNANAPIEQNRSVIQSTNDKLSSEKGAAQRNYDIGRKEAEHDQATPILEGLKRDKIQEDLKNLRKEK